MTQSQTYNIEWFCVGCDKRNRSKVDDLGDHRVYCRYCGQAHGPSRDEEYDRDAPPERP